jgi:hypothetical protein
MTAPCIAATWTYAMAERTPSLTLAEGTPWPRSGELCCWNENCAPLPARRTVNSQRQKHLLALGTPTTVRHDAARFWHALRLCAAADWPAVQIAVASCHGTALYCCSCLMSYIARLLWDQQ